MANKTFTLRGFKVCAAQNTLFDENLKLEKEKVF